MSKCFPLQRTASGPYNWDYHECEMAAIYELANPLAQDADFSLSLCRTAVVHAWLCFRRTWPPCDGCRSCGSHACGSQAQTFRRTSRMGRVLRADLPIGAALRLDGHDRTRFSNFADRGWTARSRILPAGQMIERLNITGRPRQTVPPSRELACRDPILVTPLAALP